MNELAAERDEPYQNNRLNIYTTSSAAMNVTKCGPGNARYDPVLDSIFIDEQFFDEKGYRQIYEASAYGSVVDFNKYLIFPTYLSDLSSCMNWGTGNFTGTSWILSSR
jgi:hypothetical protein